MKPSFRLDPDLAAKLKGFGCTFKTRARAKGHKVAVWYDATAFTYHDIVYAVRETYPHARMHHEAPDGDMGGTVDINLND